MRVRCFLAVCFCAAFALAAAEAFPNCEALRAMVRKDHPRLYLTRETLPQFRQHANSPGMKSLLDACRAAALRAPETPRIRANSLARIDGGKLVILKKTGDQDKVESYVDLDSFYGRTAVRCALLYRTTGEKKYFDKARTYLLAYPELLRFSHANRLMLEWWNTDKLAAIVAWDWLYDELSPADRRAFMEPMLEYMAIVTGKPGYMVNNCGPTSANYGEPGLLFPLALAVTGEPYKTDLIDRFFLDGYKNATEMMAYREETSAGTGQMVYPAANYSFGLNPLASFHFQHVVRSAAGIDGMKYYPQIRDFANYFRWMTVPAVMRNGEPGFYSYGWGNAFHVDNGVPLHLIYTHMAQVIHFCGKSDPERAEAARSVIAQLPEKFRCHSPTVLGKYAFLPFVLYGFDPSVPGRPFAPDKELGAFFPSCGILVVRSGSTLNDTYASVALGCHMGQGHYDELAFVICRKGVLTSPTGCRGNAPHHLVWWPQTIAKNAPLIRMKGEPLPPHWYPRNAPKFDRDKVFCDGGQSAKGAGRNLGITMTDRYVISGGDGTKAYSAKKCREAVRMFVYLKPDWFVIYDRLESVSPDQEKVFQMHFHSRPTCLDNVWSATEYQGKLFFTTLLPEKPRAEVIGGPGREFRTNGRNFPLGPEYDEARLERNFLGTHRIEIAPRENAEKTRFLHVLQAADLETPAMIPAKLLRDETRDGAELTLPGGEKARVWFARDGKPEAKVEFVK